MLQSCILGNSRHSTNQQYRTQEPKRSREKTKKQWQSSNSRFASLQTSDGAGIHRHAAFICVAYTRERGGSKNLTHSGITAACDPRRPAGNYGIQRIREGLLVTLIPRRGRSSALARRYKRRSNIFRTHLVCTG